MWPKLLPEVLDSLICLQSLLGPVALSKRKYLDSLRLLFYCGHCVFSPFQPDLPLRPRPLRTLPPPDSDLI